MSREEKFRALVAVDVRAQIASVKNPLNIQDPKLRQLIIDSSDAAVRNKRLAAFRNSHYGPTDPIIISQVTLSDDEIEEVVSNILTAIAA